MHFLVMSSDPAMMDPASEVFARQREYFAGHTATIVVCTAGSYVFFEREGLRVVRAGGRHKFAVLLNVIDVLVKLHAVDRVVAQAPDVLGLVGWIYAWIGKTPYLLQDHSGIAARKPFGLREWLWRPVAKRLCRSAARIRTVSQRGKRGLVEQWNIPEANVTVIPIRQDLRPFLSIQRSAARPSEPITIACIARLEPEKGVDVLLRAFAASHVKQRAILEIVGDGSERVRLKRLADRLGIAGRVRWRGRSSREHIIELLRRSAIYVQPSWFEGWGMALVEAAASELAIITTDVGCVHELLRPNQEVFVVAPGDIYGIADLLNQILQPEVWDKARQMRRDARRSVMMVEAPEQARRRLRSWLLT